MKARDKNIISELSGPVFGAIFGAAPEMLKPNQPLMDQASFDRHQYWLFVPNGESDYSSVPIPIHYSMAVPRLRIVLKNDDPAMSALLSSSHGQANIATQTLLDMLLSSSGDNIAMFSGYEKAEAGAEHHGPHKETIFLFNPKTYESLAGLALEMLLQPAMGDRMFGFPGEGAYCNLFLDESSLPSRIVTTIAKSGVIKPEQWQNYYERAVSPGIENYEFATRLEKLGVVVKKEPTHVGKLTAKRVQVGRWGLPEIG